MGLPVSAGLDIFKARESQIEVLFGAGGGVLGVLQKLGTPKAKAVFSYHCKELAAQLWIQRPVQPVSLDDARALISALDICVKFDEFSSFIFLVFSFFPS